MYTELQVSKFLFFHLEARDWYLDCSKGFVPKEDKPLFKKFADTASMEPEPMEKEPKEI